MTPPDTTHVVLLHGLGATGQAFQRFVRLLPASWVKEPVDLLGHGDGTHPESGYRLPDYAEHLAGILPGDTRPVLVGHSLGAAVAVTFAAMYPDRVRQLVLLDPPTGDIEPTTRRMLDAKLSGDIAATVNELFADMSEPLRQWTIGTWEQMAPGVARELDPRWQDWADQLTVPVTIIHGDPQQGATGAGAHGSLPGSTNIRIAGAGHYLHATHARQTADAVAEAVSYLDADRTIT